MGRRRSSAPPAATCPVCATVLIAAAERCPVCRTAVGVASSALPGAPSPTLAAEVPTPAPAAPTPAPAAPTPAPLTPVPAAVAAAPAPAPRPAAAPSAGSPVAPASGLVTAMTVLGALGVAALVLAQLLLALATRRLNSTFDPSALSEADAEVALQGLSDQVAGALALAGLGGLLILVWGALALATAILLVIWHARALQRSRLTRTDAPPFGTTLPWVAWFVPIAAWVLPWLSLAWLNRADGSPERQRRTRLLLAGWWLSWFVVGATGIWTAFSDAPTTTIGAGGTRSPDGLQTLALIAATVLLVLTVRALDTALGATRSGPSPSAPTSDTFTPTSGTVAPAVSPRDPFSWHTLDGPSRSGASPAVGADA